MAPHRALLHARRYGALATSSSSAHASQASPERVAWHTLVAPFLSSWRRSPALFPVSLGKSVPAPDKDGLAKRAWEMLTEEQVAFAKGEALRLGIDEKEEILPSFREARQKVVEHHEKKAFFEAMTKQQEMHEKAIKYQQAVAQQHQLMAQQVMMLPKDQLVSLIKDCWPACDVPSHSFPEVLLPWNFAVSSDFTRNFPGVLLLRTFTVSQLPSFPQESCQTHRTTNRQHLQSFCWRQALVAQMPPNITVGTRVGEATALFPRACRDASQHSIAIKCSFW